MPLTILVATDTFKGSLSAGEATSAIARGLRTALPAAAVHELPLSDGGEGFVATLVAAHGGSLERAETTNALGEPITADYGLLDGGRTVAIELSAAAGLTQLPASRRNPLATTTYGVGDLIAKAYARHRFHRLLLALGGSATVDGGAGMLAALGVTLLDAAGRPIPLGGGGLGALARLDTSAMSPALREAEVLVAVDVDNPLLGERGAAAAFGPQKGATPAMVATLEANLRHFADILAAATGVAVHAMPGTGSAGGVPAGLVALAGARMVPGFELVAEAVELDRRLAESDWVVSGEGQLDRTSFEGKVIGRLAARCRARKLPLVALAGNLDPAGEALLAEAGGAAFSLVPGPMAPETAMADAAALLTRRAAGLGRLIGMRPTVGGPVVSPDHV